MRRIRIIKAEEMNDAYLTDYQEGQIVYVYERGDIADGNAGVYVADGYAEWVEEASLTVNKE